jgi:flagellar hook-length control protein FliK
MGISVIPAFAASAGIAASSGINGLPEGMPGEFAALLSGEIKNLTDLLPVKPGQNLALAGLGAERALAKTPLPASSQVSLPLLAKLQSPGIINSLPGKAAVALQLATEGLDRKEIATLHPEKADMPVSLSAPALKLDEADTLPPTTELNGEAFPAVDPALMAALTGNPALQPQIRAPENKPLDANTELPGRRIAGDFANAAQDDAPPTPTERSSAKPGSQDFSRTLESFSLASNAQKGVNLAGNEAANLAVETKGGNEAINPALLNNSAAALANTTRGASEARGAQQTTITPHLQENNWSQHFGEKVVWLAKSDQQSAQININPPQLGPIQIRLNLSGDQATMTFASPHLDVRQAIENALPQLKEMLSSAGINLGQADVGANMAQHKQETPFQSANGKRGGDENAILPANEIAVSTGTSPILQRGRGLVDLFA